MNETEKNNEKRKMAIDWTCGDCSYFEDVAGECHRNPPTVLISAAPPAYVTLYPTVAATDKGCGECVPSHVAPAPPVP